MYMQLFYHGESDTLRKTLCEVSIYAMDWTNYKKEKFWDIKIDVYFNIKNTLEFVMVNPSRSLVEDLDSIQEIPVEYREGSNDRFPQMIAYKLDDPKLSINKCTIIEEIRKQLRETAERHGLYYNED